MEEIFNSRLVFLLLSRSIKSKEKKTQDFLFAPFYFNMEKELCQVNFCHQGQFWFSVMCVNGNKYFLTSQQLIVMKTNSSQKASFKHFFPK